MNWAAIMWLILLVVFLLAEAATVGVVSTWFALGALVAMVTALLQGPVWLQTVLFVAVSAGLLLQEKGSFLKDGQDYTDIQ